MMSEVYSSDIKLKRESRVAAVDDRSVRSAFETYACPDVDDRQIQIVRPFAVLSKTTYRAPVTPPIGPAYLAAVLEEAGYSVGIVDAIGEDLLNIRRSRCDAYNLQGLGIKEIVERIPPENDNHWDMCVQFFCHPAR